MIGLYRELERLEREGKKIKIGIIGVGEMGTDMVCQISRMKGIETVALSDKIIEKAKNACKLAGIEESKIVSVKDPEDGDKYIEAGKIVITDDFRIIPYLAYVDVIIEATGDPDVGTEACLLALKNRKHFVTMSVEMDITVGVILHKIAETCGVVYTLAAGDEPTAIKELYDFAVALGFRVIAAGKGKNNPLDRFATPETLEKIAKERGTDPFRLTEFVDGTKTMVEMAAVSNATGLIPDVRGMHGPQVSMKELLRTFSLKEQGGILEKEGIVDYVIGDLKPGVFLVFTTDHPRLKEALILRDMGQGPNYLLVRPYHLCSIEAPLTAVLAYLEKKPIMYSANQVSSVVAAAKRDLKAGEVLDKIGGRTFFGIIDVHESVKEFLPVGLAKNAVIKSPIKKGEMIPLSEVEINDTIVYKVWRLLSLVLEGTMDEKKAIEEALKLV